MKRKGFELARVLVPEDEPRKVHRNFGNAIYVNPFEGAEDDDDDTPNGTPILGL